MAESWWRVRAGALVVDVTECGSAGLGMRVFLEVLVWQHVAKVCMQCYQSSRDTFMALDGPKPTAYGAVSHRSVRTSFFLFLLFQFYREESKALVAELSLS